MFVKAVIYTAAVGAYASECVHDLGGDDIVKVTDCTDVQ